MNVDTFGLFLFPAQLDIYTDVLCRQRVQRYIEHCSAMSFNDENHAIKQAHHQTFCVIKYQNASPRRDPQTKQQFYCVVKL